MIVCGGQQVWALDAFSKYTVNPYLYRVQLQYYYYYCVGGGDMQIEFL